MHAYSSSHTYLVSIFLVRVIPQVFGPYFGPKFFANFKTEENVRSVLKQVYCRDNVVDDDLVKL